MKTLIKGYRKTRVRVKQFLGLEPEVQVELPINLEFHGSDYGGWAIPQGMLNRNSVVVDVGIGQDITFSESIIGRYQCVVHGFDPTPQAMSFIKSAKPSNFIFHNLGLGERSGSRQFYLPLEKAHVSGSLIKYDHLGSQAMIVSLLSIRGLMEVVKADRIDLLKLDIEGAEYEVINSQAFCEAARHISFLCIEFHHRWECFSCSATERAVSVLRSHGFRCAWRNDTTNEEFLFVNVGLDESLRASVLRMK